MMIPDEMPDGWHKSAGNHQEIAVKNSHKVKRVSKRGYDFSGFFLMPEICTW